MTLHQLSAGDRQMVIDTSHGIPEIMWFGEPLDGEPAMLQSLGERPVANAQLETEGPLTIVPSEADGWPGMPGLQGRRLDGTAWSPRFVAAGEPEKSGTSLSATAIDEVAALSVTSTITLHDSGVAMVSVSVTNTGADDYIIDRLAITLPIGGEATELQVPEGRWVHEFHEVRLPWRVGATELANRRGRTSADKPPWVFAGTAGFTNQTGTVWGAHLGWSGNAAVRSEVLTDGRRVLQLGELLLGDEVRLAPSEIYTTPTVYFAVSQHGLNGVSQAFHRYLRSRPQHPKVTRPRPIHMNTWEAVYFNHDLDTLKALADAAAEVGAERYVLDDGWFGGRRDDSAGLGDWWVSPDAWPTGLEPLIEHVRSLGMEFGIWVEPEMINPDSDLFRAHPEWALGADGYDPIQGRNQLVLDLTNEEAWQYLFGHLDRLLADHDVSYVKWDMNRDLTQPASSNRAAAHHQTLAVYRLIDALRERHSGVDIESCSSGGSRVDFGILERTDRFWTSDSNDALERQYIQRGFLRLCPPEVMGAHIGPLRSHTSGRQHTLGFRATTALFGHFGIEWNLLDATEEDRAALAKVIDFHKEHRELLHSGQVWQVDTHDPGLVVMGVVGQGATEALFSIAQVAISRYGSPGRLRLPGLDAEATYDVELVMLGDTKLGLAISQPGWVPAGLTGVTGAQLVRFGLQLPALDPESAVLIKVIAST